MRYRYVPDFVCRPQAGQAFAEKRVYAPSFVHALAEKLYKSPVYHKLLKQ